MFYRDGYGDGQFASGEAFSMTIGSTVDRTPPVVGSPRVTGEVFTNSCGAKALRWEDKNSYDDSGIGTRLPVHVLLEGENQTFETFSSTFGGTDAVNINLISRDPYLGQCFGSKGLETLNIAFGESVEISITLYDFSGNRAETVTQTIEWPIRKTTE